MEMLRELVDLEGQTIVMVTHDPVAAAYADRVVFLVDGQMADDLTGLDAGRIAAWTATGGTRARDARAVADGRAGGHIPATGRVDGHAPAAGRAGEHTPTAGRAGEHTPTAGRTGEHTPTAGRTGGHAPATGRTGGHTPTAGHAPAVTGTVAAQVPEASC
jgi:energy-coupling factor transporter ATP-binding protein EcfA2